LRRRFGIAADRVAIQASRPWYVNVIIVVLALGILAWAARAGYEAWQGVSYPGLADMQAKLEAQQRRIAELEEDNKTLRATVQAGGSSLQIERTAQDALSKQVKALSEENARLKQDISLFEGLSGGNGVAPAAILSVFVVEPGEGAGRYRYRLTAVMTGGRDPKDREFRGHYQLVVKMQSGGQAAIMTVPAANDANREKFALKFKQFQRVEGVFQLPEGAVPATVEARLLSDGVTRATKTVTL
jgi:cell division protein FtsB